MLCRAAYFSGVELAEETLLDEMRDAHVGIAAPDRVEESHDADGSTRDV